MPDTAFFDEGVLGDWERLNAVDVDDAPGEASTTDFNARKDASKPQSAGSVLMEGSAPSPSEISLLLLSLVLRKNAGPSKMPDDETGSIEATWP